MGYEREAFALMLVEKSNYSVSRMARLLEVSRSGFYAWCKRVPSKRAVRAERIEAKVAWFHGESDEVSGSPRILADLREDGEVISRKTVAKAMRKLGLRGICPKKWRTTTIIDQGDTYPADAAKRAWDTGVLNAVWVGDITYLRTWQGWLYLAVVIDAHSRRVIGWAIDEHMRTDLVEDALRMAITLRGELPERVVFHTDRGTQGGFNRSSQHLDDGGGSRWHDRGTRRRAELERRQLPGGSGQRIGRCARPCVHRGALSPRVRCSGRSGD
ncbi:MAG: IS3 family transposase [Geodermatophilaceae bacterium]|nr:IS3 family transposase [Geodermatophilaceae bacterium]